MTEIQKTERHVSRHKFFATGSSASVHAWACTNHMTEGSLEVKLPTKWTDGKAEVGRVREEKGRRKMIRCAKR